MKQKLFTGQLLMDKIIKGAMEAKDVISTTMGPNGGCCALITNNKVRETKDGATIAKSFIGSGDEVEKYGAQLLTDASKKMAEIVGDGSTTVVVLTYEILKAVHKLRTTGKQSFIIESALDFVNKFVKQTIENIAIKVDCNSNYLEQIATVAANDAYIGNNIYELFKQLGNDAMIVVDESKSDKDIIKSQDGYFFERGFISS